MKPQEYELTEGEQVKIIENVLLMIFSSSKLQGGFRTVPLQLILESLPLKTMEEPTRNQLMEGLYTAVIFTLIMCILIEAKITHRTCNLML